jgi:hypothetical protein
MLCRAAQGGTRPTGRATCRPRWAAGVLLVASLAAVRPARAELGDGLEVGPGRLKLGIDLSLRYDDAAGIVPPSAPPAGDLVLLIGGRFALDIRTDSTYVSFGGSLNWNQYLGLDTADKGYGFLGATANGEFDFNTNRPVGVDISEALNRNDTTPNPVFGIGVLSLNNTTRARLRIRPGGGALEFGLSGEFDAQQYLPQVTGTGVQNVAAYDNIAAKGLLDGSWRVLPKTGILAEVGYGLFDYFNSSPTVQNTNVNPLVANIGFGTLLTTRVSFAVKGGYTGLFFAGAKGPTNDFDAQLELGFHFTDAVFARIGGAQLVLPVGGATKYFDDDRAYLELGLKALPNLAFSIIGTFDYDRLGFNTGNVLLYSVTASGDWSMTHWLHLVANVNYTARATAMDTSEFNYNRFIALLGLSALF